jgi:hypothetical protein
LPADFAPLRRRITPRHGTSAMPGRLSTISRQSGVVETVHKDYTGFPVGESSL